MSFRLGGLFLLVFLFSSLSFAAKERKGATRKSVSFEDQLIEGQVQKPELFYLLQKKQFNFGRLIKLRENFLPEMKKSAEDIQR